MRGTFKLRKEEWDDEFGQHYERVLLPHRPLAAERAGPARAQPAPRSPTPCSAGRGDRERHQVHQHRGSCRSSKGRVSLSSVSGPITMYDIAGQAGAKGTTYFVWAMALISVNLGLINLLPIPVLDGGHLLFFLLEASPAQAAPASHPRGGEPRGDGHARAAHAGGLQERRRAALGRHRHAGAQRSGHDPERARTARRRAGGGLRVLPRQGVRAAALEAELASAVQLDARDRALATELSTER